MFSPLLTKVSSKGGVNLKEHKLTWQKKTEREWMQWPFSIHLHSKNHSFQTYTCHIPPHPQIDDPVSCFEKTEAIRQKLLFPIIQSLFFFPQPHREVWRILVLQLGLQPGSQQWKQWVLIPGPPENSLPLFNLSAYSCNLYSAFPVQLLHF